MAMRLALTFAALALVACSDSKRSDAPPVPSMSKEPPLIVAHRGASGHLPEHTLEGYSLAIDMGADYVEPDLVVTKDGVLVARHDAEIGGTTDAAAKFPDRKRTATIDGQSIEGWFVEDFTLAELKTLRARERMKTRSHANDGKFLVPTFDEVLDLVRRRGREAGRTIGVYPETKHPTYFAERDLAIEPRLIEALARHGYGKKGDAVIIQSFEIGNLKALRADSTPYLLAQLVDNHGAPYDAVTRGEAITYADMVTPAGIREVATYADIIAPDKGLVLPIAMGVRFEAPTDLVSLAHAAGLRVHVWTMRSDVPNLPLAWKGDAIAEWRRFAALGVDGMFGDFPDDGVKALRGGAKP